MRGGRGTVDEGSVARGCNAGFREGGGGSRGEDTRAREGERERVEDTRSGRKGSDVLPVSIIIGG